MGNSQYFSSNELYGITIPIDNEPLDNSNKVTGQWHDIIIKTITYNRNEKQYRLTRYCS